MLINSGNWEFVTFWLLKAYILRASLFMQVQSNVVKLKIAVLGNAKAGKSCFIRKLAGQAIQQQYIDEYVPTDEFEMTLVQLKKDKITYQIQLWDCGTAFTDHHSHLRQAFFRYSSAAFVIFDVNNPKWKEEIPFWISQAHARECFLIYAIGTKLDCFFKSCTSVQSQKKSKNSLLTEQNGRKEFFSQYEYQFNEFFQQYQIRHYYQSACDRLSSQITNIFVNIHDDQQKVSRSSLARGIRLDNSVTQSFIQRINLTNSTQGDKQQLNRDSRSLGSSKKHQQLRFSEYQPIEK